MDLYQIRSKLASGKTIYDLPLRVAFYARVSTEKEEQLASLENQSAFFCELIKKSANWSLCGSYVDEGKTGTSVKNRTAFLKMMEDAGKGQFDFLLTKEVSRFARNTLDSIGYTRQLIQKGVGVFFLNDNINTLEPDSEFRLTIMASMAQEESRKTSSRVKFGLQQAMKNGVVLGGDRMLGYIRKEKKLVLVPAEAEAVKQAYSLFDQGYHYKEISRALFQAGICTASGKELSSNAVKNILCNPKYKGFYCGNKTTSLDLFQRKKIRKPAEEWLIWKDVSGEIIPAIVEEDLWERCAERRRELDSRYIRNGQGKGADGSVNSTRAYSGKIFCKNCGSPYWRTLRKCGGGSKELWQCAAYKNGGSKRCRAPILYSDDIDQLLEWYGRENTPFQGIKKITSSFGEKEEVQQEPLFWPEGWKRVNLLVEWENGSEATLSYLQETRKGKPHQEPIFCFSAQRAAETSGIGPHGSAAGICTVK